MSPLREWWWRYRETVKGEPRTLADHWMVAKYLARAMVDREWRRLKERLAAQKEE